MSGLRVPLGRAVTALLLLAVLSTAAFVHLIWERTATENIEKIVASLDVPEQAAGIDFFRIEPPK